MSSPTYKEKTFLSWKAKLFCMTTFFSPNVCSTRGCEYKAIGKMLESPLKSKLQSYFLEEIFQPAESKSFKTEKCSICDALRDLAPFVQFKKREKHPWRSANCLFLMGVSHVF